jgi:hypothetical protein
MLVEKMMVVVAKNEKAGGKNKLKLFELNEAKRVSEDKICMTYGGQSWTICCIKEACATHHHDEKDRDATGTVVFYYPEDHQRLLASHVLQALT